MPAAIPAAIGLGALGAGAAGVIAPTTAAIVGAGALSAGANIFGANKAAKAQTNAAQTASNTQTGMFNTLQQNLEPYNTAGQSALTSLNTDLPSLTAPVTMDQSTLEKTPGYQFQLYQGQKQLENGYAQRGLGSSGAALKGAAQYVTGLADSNYQQQFQNAVTNASNTYGRLLGLTQLGENAGAGVGSGAISTGQSLGQNITGAGNAQAAASLGTSSALGNAFSSYPNALLTNRFLNNLPNYNNNSNGQYSDFGSGNGISARSYAYGNNNYSGTLPPIQNYFSS